MLNTAVEVECIGLNAKQMVYAVGVIARRNTACVKFWSVLAF